MRLVKFVSTGLPDKNHMQSAIEIANKYMGEMSLGEKKEFGTGNFRTTLKIQDNNDVLLVLINLDKT